MSSIEVGGEGHPRVATIKTGISVACTCEMRALRSIRGGGRGRGGGATGIQLRSLEYKSPSIDVSRAIFIRIARDVPCAVTTYCDSRCFVF